MTAHWITHLGVPMEIHPRAMHGFDRAFAILEFAPRGSRTSWRYATNGMSSRIQACPQPGVRVRTEVYAATAQRAPWMCDLLTALAAYPWDQQTWVCRRRHDRTSGKPGIAKLSLCRNYVGGARCDRSAGDWPGWRFRADSHSSIGRAASRGASTSQARKQSAVASASLFSGHRGIIDATELDVSSNLQRPS